MAMYSLNMIQWNNVVAASLIFLIIVLVLVIVLLVAKKMACQQRRSSNFHQRGKKMIHAEGAKAFLPHLEKTVCISRRHAAEKEAAVSASCR